MKKRLECRITGRVQVVMFRDFSQRKARSLGLVGFVQNLSDKSVFLVAEGEENILKELLGYLHKGPILSRVDNIEVVYKKPQNEFNDFEIIY
ncbi:MAG: acylphosphatase [Candidatus Pacebacteria bacterium]|nr:acylphosphatase [Candidatus Paceibacterota bacterium]